MCIKSAPKMTVFKVWCWRNTLFCRQPHQQQPQPHLVCWDCKAGREFINALEDEGDNQAPGPRVLNESPKGFLVGRRCSVTCSSIAGTRNFVNSLLSVHLHTTILYLNFCMWHTTGEEKNLNSSFYWLFCLLPHCLTATHTSSSCHKKTPVWVFVKSFTCR